MRSAAGFDRTKLQGRFTRVSVKAEENLLQNIAVFLPRRYHLQVTTDISDETQELKNIWV